MDIVIQIILDDILSFHNELENTFVISSGIRQIGLLESAVHAPFQTFYGEELYPSVYEKASQLCFGICNNHPFVDGNKRTALHSMLVFLDISGIEIDCSDDELEAIIISVASNTLSSNELSNWLKLHSKQLD